jgi:hypothetical protein
MKHIKKVAVKTQAGNEPKDPREPGCIPQGR